ncbi:universal stress protein [Pseudonocardia bannensis]|uniref:Universal stress protein n=1 Tax=Pseudonocardia bannensis TaxID=630973 RepID=A0A848DMP1_9PSEU|nr:universal stress protein [Pseudonocardia bannensis]NMH94060.1 universal stress protein [Pseudonocardia bannensis]
MTHSRPVLVGADGTGSAVRAVAWAAEEAGLRSCPLVIVCAGGATGNAARVLERARTIARATADVDVRVELWAGDPAEILTVRSLDADLLVVGCGAGRFDTPAPATVSRRAGCPVVAVRAAAGRPVPDRARPIVVAVDGSPDSRAAVDLAARIADERGSPLVAVHVWFESPAAAVRRLRHREPEPGREAAERLLGGCLAGQADRYPGLVVRREIVRGLPTWSLLERSDSAQLMVVGRGGHGRRTPGRRTRALLRGGVCPVAIACAGSPTQRSRPVLARVARAG